MTPEQLARSIWVKRHMAALLSKRAQQLGNRREARARISSQIGRLNQQVKALRTRLDKLTDTDTDM
jgi:hypothetical protein